MIFYFLYYFLFFPFILLHMCPLFPFFYFLFSSRTFHNISFAPLFLKKKKKKKLLFSSEKRERRRQTERGERLGRIGLGLQPPLVVLPTNRLGLDRLFLSFFFFLSYLLVLMIQLYFKNWILFCVLCLD